MNSTEDISTRYSLVSCFYPVSGVYTRFQRMLSVIVILFMLSFKLHTWLTASGVALLAVSSTTAGIHSIILSFDPGASYDADFLALFPVLYLAVMSALLCVIFPPSFARKFCLCWAMLIGFASILTLVNASKVFSRIEDSKVLVKCNNPGTCDQPCTGLQIQTLFRRPPYDQLEAFSWSSVLVPSGTNTTISTTSAAGTNLTRRLAVIPGYLARGPAADYPSLFNLGFIRGYIISQTIIRTLAFNINNSPVAMRNYYFLRTTKSRVIKRTRYSTGKRAILASLLWLHSLWKVLLLCLPLMFLSPLLRVVMKLLWRRGWVDFQSIDDFSRLESNRGKGRYYFAKTVALAWYLWACACYLALPIIVLTIYVVFEMALGGLPESESIKAVGQWSPWVAVGITFLAAVVNKVCFASEGERTRIFLHCADVEGCRYESCRRTVSVPEKGEKKGWHRFCQWFLLLHLWHAICFWWEDFKAWWKDPLQVSLKTAPMDFQSDELLSNIPSAWERLMGSRPSDLPKLSRQIHTISL